MNKVGSVLADTNIVIAYFRGEDSLRSLFYGPAPIGIPWVVIGELRFGAQKAQRREEQLSYIKDLLSNVVLVFPDLTTAELYGDIKAELEKLGRRIPDNDIWIAALARQYDLPLATRDTHFANVPGLRTLAW
ncbi:MAG: type II toxin-antitoxin system VapC family toxin [Acidobacteria bacterium]|nr:type II toxin-antitoxin system VapC family toxin [Acidobacteriota bacterium]